MKLMTRDRSTRPIILRRQQTKDSRGTEPDMDMGWVHPWVGLGGLVGWVWLGWVGFGPKFSCLNGLRWVGFSFSNLLIFFSIAIIQLRKSVTVVYPYRIQYRVNSSAN